MLYAQSSSPLLIIAPSGQVAAKRDQPVTVKVSATLNEGFHLNSHTPAESYLIPLTLKWNPGVLEAGDIQYPAPHMLKAFSEKPLSVLTGKFDISTKFKVPANAPVGAATVTGKLRYQACNDKSCFPPKTVDVKIPVDVK